MISKSEFTVGKVKRKEFSIVKDKEIMLSRIIQSYCHGVDTYFLTNDMTYHFENYYTLSKFMWIKLGIFYLPKRYRHLLWLYMYLKYVQNINWKVGSKKLKKIQPSNKKERFNFLSSKSLKSCVI